uniref:Uncharacterized protein n=1 Tax=Tetraselmis sp. GSL018 TaxID=582737 RepID=A0A061QKY8_9CHLO
MVRENFFHIEKHLNDTIHNPQLPGRSHTEREIKAAAVALGRQERPRRVDSHQRLELGEAVGGGCVLLQQRGMAIRIDTSSLLKPQPKKRSDPQKLDANNRGNMMARIQAGGTGGPPASAAAAAYLSGALHGDDDGPTVVLSGDLTFQDGWAAADASPGTRGALPPPGGAACEGAGSSPPLPPANAAAAPPGGPLAVTRSGLGRGADPVSNPPLLRESFPPGGAACEGAGSSPPLPPANAAAAPPGGPLAVCRGKERRKERRGKKKERSKETRKHERKRSRGGSDAREKPRRRSRKDAAP